MYNNVVYADVVFSKHAKERMLQRLITEDMVRAAIYSPDKRFLEEDGDTKFIRKVGGAEVFVVCKPLPEESKWLVKSTWVRGEDDYGNKVERRGRYQGGYRGRKPIASNKPRPQLRTNKPQPRTGFGAEYGALIAVLITLAFILAYVLTNR